MKYRIAAWAAGAWSDEACAAGAWAGGGLVVAGWWAIYFAWANKDYPTPPFVSALVHLTCPIAIAGAHLPISIYWVFVANAATYALVGVIAELLRRQFSHSR